MESRESASSDTTLLISVRIAKFNRVGSHDGEMASFKFFKLRRMEKYLGILVVIFVMAVTDVYSLTVQDGFKSLKRGWRLKSSMIGRLHQQSFLDCVQECMVRKRCKSINYIRRFLTCEMNHSNLTTLLINAADTVYSDVTSFPREMVSQCKDNDCDIKSKCVRKTMGGKTCEISDCGFPVSYGSLVTIYDTISVESSVKFTCSFDSTVKKTVSMICDKDGNWVKVLNEQNCQEHRLRRPSSKSGVYAILTDYGCRLVYCDMTTDGGGWTVIQKRIDGSTDFIRNWKDYKNGFGNLKTNFWLGNDMIGALTTDKTELRIDLWHGSNQSTEILTFDVSDEKSGYQLIVRSTINKGDYTGEYDCSFPSLNGMQFTTYDKQYIIRSTYTQHKGGWWSYRRQCWNSLKCEELEKRCPTSRGQFFDHFIPKTCQVYCSNLNGEYGNSDFAKGFTWKSSPNSQSYNESLKRSVMMIR